MRFKILIIVLIFGGHSQLLYAGAWDIGPFENDDALDFVHQLLEDDSRRRIWVPLGEAFDPNKYIDATTGSQILAAAEVVAALRGEPRPNLPEELSKWLGSQIPTDDIKLIGTAKMCVERVLNPERSELAQLWQDTDQYNDWRAAGEDLINRLQ